MCDEAKRRTRSVYMVSFDIQVHTSSGFENRNLNMHTYYNNLKIKRQLLG